ncbi:MAG: methyltransferase domain-containing protein [Deltaproteobacteria bacterium]|nr:methyltransferase domain-containing protein [Deltaproteobacteria bacterium]
MQGDKPRIGILIVAYNAVTTLARVLGRVPPDVMAEVEEIVVFDDASHDDTFILAHGYKTLNKISKLSIYKNPKNLGYGGNQKLGYEYFINKGFDAVVLLHGDGQYAPEFLRNIYQPIVEGRADAVFGSRMMKEHGGPLKGGMPLYKFIGNRILTAFENRSLDMGLTEFHSGYRAYSINALKNISFQTCSDDFHFDTEIIIKLNHLQYRILEVPIPTYYGSEISYVNGFKYAFNVFRSVIDYKLAIYGFKKSQRFLEFFKKYPLREHRFSSHDIIAHFVGMDKSILDLGCGSGFLAGKLRPQNKYICGMDIEGNETNRKECDEFHEVNLEHKERFSGIDISEYDVVLCADIVEHLREPGDLLTELSAKMHPDSRLILSVPNVANLVIRLSFLLGKFSYSDSGILDKTHLRFFTHASIRELIEKSGFRILHSRSTPIPFGMLFGDRSTMFAVRVFEYIFYRATNILRKLLSYQFVFVLVPERGMRDISKERKEILENIRQLPEIEGRGV